MFIELNFTFPQSGLTYLNLANNDIYGIRDNVFQNLQSMRVLILSYNDLELLSPDAFKVMLLFAVESRKLHVIFLGEIPIRAFISSQISDRTQTGS